MDRRFPEFAPDVRRELWRVAEEMADAAAARCLPLFRSPELRTENKSADRKSVV